MPQRTRTEPTVKPGADRRQQDQIALLQPAGLDRIVERQRDRRGGGVAEASMLMTTFSSGRPMRSAADMMMRLFAWCDTNRSRSSPVRLLPLQQPLADLAGVAHRELEHRLPILLDVVQPLVDGLVRRRQLAAAGRHAQRRTAAAVDHVLEVEDADVRIVGDGPSTTAPAPSPNSTHVARSV